MRLEGKRVLVTGGASGLGRAFVRALLGEGARVAFTYRSSTAEADALQLELDLRVISLHCDVRDPEAVALTVKQVAAEFGGLDLLVNNAGVFEAAMLDEITVEQWDAIFATNVRGPFLFSQMAFPHLRRSSGRIIHLGSLGGIKPWSTHAHYSSSKAALHMLTKTMAKAWAPGISVNCIAPGMIPKENSAEGTRFIAKTPFGRNGEPADAVDALLFFATASRFITGQIMVVDGGLGL